MEEEKKPENEVKNNDIEKIDVPLDEITSEDITEASFDSELLLKAIHDHNTEELKRIFDTIPDADIAKACEELDIKDVFTLFRDTKSEQNASLYDELSRDMNESLV